MVRRGRVQQTTDSLFIFLDQFGNELAFQLKPDGLSGVLRRQDGSGPAYYKGSITADGRLTGETVDVHGGQQFTGVLNPSAALPDAYGLTWLKEGYTSFDFSFPDVNGHLISLERQTDSAFVRKVLTSIRQGQYYQDFVKEFTVEVETLLRE